MTIPELVAVTGATEDDRSQRMDMKTFTYPQKACDNGPCVFNRFSIGGITGWRGEFREGRLIKIRVTTSPYQMEQHVITFTQAYGKPKNLRRYISKTNGGLELDDFTATWVVKDAEITMFKHINRDSGVIVIEDLAVKREDDRRAQEQKQRNSRDF